MSEREFFVDNILVRIHSINEMILVDRPCAMGGSLISTFLGTVSDLEEKGAAGVGFWGHLPHPRTPTPGCDRLVRV